MGAIQTVHVQVTDTVAALRLYRDVLGLRIEREGEISRDRLDAWGVAPEHRMRCTELSCGGYAVGRVNLIERVPPAGTHVRQDLPGRPDGPCDVGVKAMDFYPPPGRRVVDAVAELEAAGYPPRSRPVAHQEAGLDSHELLFTGPDEVGVLVMEGSHGDLYRDRGDATGYSEVSTVALIGDDVEASRRFYGALGLDCHVDVAPDPEASALIAEISGMPLDTPLHLLLYREPGEPSGKVLLVHVPRGAGRRLRGRMHPDHVGIGLVSMPVQDLAAVARRVVAEGGGRLVREPLPVDGITVALVRGPNEELIELQETG